MNNSLWDKFSKRCTCSSPSHVLMWPSLSKLKALSSGTMAQTRFFIHCKTVMFWFYSPTCLISMEISIKYKYLFENDYDFDFAWGSNVISVVLLLHACIWSVIHFDMLFQKLWDIKLDIWLSQQGSNAKNVRINAMLIFFCSSTYTECNFLLFFKSSLLVWTECCWYVFGIGLSNRCSALKNFKVQL